MARMMTKALLAAVLVVLAAAGCRSTDDDATPSALVRVPNVVGLKVEDATNILQLLILEWGLRCSDDGPEGVVVTQHPKPGTTVTVGSGVMLHVGSLIRCSRN
jgi:beta-lactam-binding protein with PASTA domain